MGAPQFMIATKGFLCGAPERADKRDHRRVRPADRVDRTGRGRTLLHPGTDLCRARVIKSGAPKAILRAAMTAPSPGKSSYFVWLNRGEESLDLSFSLRHEVSQRIRPSDEPARLGTSVVDIASEALIACGRHGRGSDSRNSMFNVIADWLGAPFLACASGQAGADGAVSSPHLALPGVRAARRSAGSDLDPERPRRGRPRARHSEASRTGRGGALCREQPQRAF